MSSESKTRPELITGRSRNPNNISKKLMKPTLDLPNFKFRVISSVNFRKKWIYHYFPLKQFSKFVCMRISAFICVISRNKKNFSEFILKLFELRKCVKVHIKRLILFFTSIIENFQMKNLKFFLLPAFGLGLKPAR